MSANTGDVLGGRYEILGSKGSGTLADIRNARNQLLDRLFTAKLVTGGERRTRDRKAERDAANDAANNVANSRGLKYRP